MHFSDGEDGWTPTPKQGGSFRASTASVAGIFEAKIKRHAWKPGTDTAVPVEYGPGQKLPGHDIALRAKSKISPGFGLYSPLAGVGNNCENFARWCVTGKDESTQSVRAVVRHM